MIYHAFIVCAAPEGFINMEIACFQFPRAAEWLVVIIFTTKSVWDNSLVSRCARASCHSVRFSTSPPLMIVPLDVDLSLALSRMRIFDAMEMTIVVLIPAVACAAKTKTVYLHRCSVPNPSIVQQLIASFQFPRAAEWLAVAIQSLRAFRRAAVMFVWGVEVWSWGLARGGPWRSSKVLRGPQGSLGSRSEPWPRRIFTCESSQ